MSGSGALTDLATATSKQMDPLTGGPDADITFFKTLIRRHTRFAMEDTMIPIPNISSGSSIHEIIHRNGDLIADIGLSMMTPAISRNFLEGTDAEVGFVRKLGCAMIRQVELEIGSTVIVRGTGSTIYYSWQIEHDLSMEQGFRELIGDKSSLTELRGVDDVEPSCNNIIPAQRIIVPFGFWLSKESSNYLPMVAAPHNDLMVRCEFVNFDKLFCFRGESKPNFSNLQFTDVNLLVRHIYLDDHERETFATLNHEYLIQQKQLVGGPSGISISQPFQQEVRFEHKASLSHPCKEFAWWLSVGAFNGRGLGSCPSGTSRGRFLAYSHTDEWSKAINNAVENIVLNSIAPVNGVIAGPLNTSSYVVSPWTAGDVIPIACIAAIPAGSAGIAHVVRGNGSTVRVTVINATGATDAPAGVNVESTGTGVTLAAGQVAAYIFKSANDITQSLMTKDGIDLNDIWQYAEVEITMYHSNPSIQEALVTAVSVPRHSLKMEHMSIPTSDWEDNRLYTLSGTNGSNPHDTTVIQPFNTGLNLDGSGNPFKSGYLTLANNERFREQGELYFDRYQAFKHHTRTPQPGYCTYSHALHPEEHQPSGAVNASRIDHVGFIMTLSDRTRAEIPTKLDFLRDSIMYITADNYNSIRFVQGLVGLTWST